MKRLNFLIRVISVSALIGLSACAKKGSTTPPAAVALGCAGDFSKSVAGETGTGLAFIVDPMVSSANSTLSPTSVLFDNYRTPMPLSHLGGFGILQGSYVDIRSGNCQDSYGAQNNANNFQYSHSDSRFQEVMSYVWGDLFRAKLDQNGVLAPKKSVEVIAHCEQDDNAYYAPAQGNSAEYVCLGDSVATKGASYADDGVVVIHELEHATTTHTYSETSPFNQFMYDEAGSMNEGISDFMGLMMTESYLPLSFDPKIFSRWGLGTFMGKPYFRGAHACPVYDSAFPNCGNYRNDATGFSADNNTLSFSYPDGLGWPYAREASGSAASSPGYIQATFASFYSQEEIHNADTIISGTLWDIFTAIKANHSGDDETAKLLMMKLVTQSISMLPKPVVTINNSPITFLGLASELVANATAAGLTAQDNTSLLSVLTNRGLQGGPHLPSSWAAVGPGFVKTPGMEVFDDPATFLQWGVDPTLIHQTAEQDQLIPGDFALIWLDIANTGAKTAGGVMLDITSSDPAIKMDDHYNYGFITTSRAQIMYQKINGSEIVTALTSTNPGYNVPTGNSYFTSNPKFDQTYKTGLWISVDPAAAHGKVVTLTVIATPANGEPSTVSFPVTIN